jgi:murein DD-endopeptidase
MLFHAGIDLRAYYEPFYAFADGFVLKLGYDERSGNYLIVSHGKLQTVYCHLSQIWVNEGEGVSAGQILGVTGNTGETTAPHLHFGMRWEGKVINPQQMIERVMKKNVAL